MVKNIEYVVSTYDEDGHFKFNICGDVYIITFPKIGLDGKVFVEVQRQGNEDITEPFIECKSFDEAFQILDSIRLHEEIHANFKELMLNKSAINLAKDKASALWDRAANYLVDQELIAMKVEEGYFFDKEIDPADLRGLPEIIEE